MKTPVLEQNPSKQGLKPFHHPTGPETLNRFRAKSIKTRIETFHIASLLFQIPDVLEQNPSKQGLKRFFQASASFRRAVLEQNPSKQGLKRFFQASASFRRAVLEQNPSKQGLKHIESENKPKSLRKF